MATKHLKQIIVNNQIKLENMKQILKLAILIAIFSTTSCHAQRMVQRTTDARKLEINKKEFIGRPLKVLLSQIGPPIKSAIGNPSETNTNENTFIIFYFVDKKGFIQRDSKGDKPTRIDVILKKTPGKNYAPIIPSNPWTDKQTKEYGDMIVLRIRVTGEN